MLIVDIENQKTGLIVMLNFWTSFAGSAYFLSSGRKLFGYEGSRLYLRILL